jgi:glycosyltransferase involved in cell wall biosynthesis
MAELLALRESSGAGAAAIFLYETFTDAAGKPRPVTDAMVADLYRLADGLLFPSRYEGFGIPILEAGLAGLPIFCSDIAPLRATAGDAATYFETDEPAGAIARRIAAALAADQGGALRRRVRTTATWEAIYHRVIAPLLQLEA